jgi:hypothetical protein
MQIARYIHAKACLTILVITLLGCAQVQAPQQDLSPLQDAYAVRDSIVAAKKGLNDARDLGKISKTSYDVAWKAADDSDKIVKAQIDAAHSGGVQTVSKTAVADAQKKLDEAKAAGGIQ